MKINKYSIENLYFLNSVTILRKFYAYIFPSIITVFFLILLANINEVSNIKVINNEVTTNFSGYLTIKSSVLFMKNIFNPDIGLSNSVGEIFKVIYSSSALSLLFLLSSLVFSSVVGILIGTIEGYRSKKRNIKSLGTLIAFSIPDVMIVLIGLLLYIYISQNFPQIRDALPLKEFILPLICLSTIPTIYISRITFVTIQDEVKKAYIINAKAKGLSRKRIFIYELLPAVIFKVVDTMPTIMTMLLSNMIVVEYLFNYYGIAHYLLYFYNRHNVDRFVALAIALGVIYILFAWGIQLLSKFINPIKREVNK